MTFDYWPILILLSGIISQCKHLHGNKLPLAATINISIAIYIGTACYSCCEICNLYNLWKAVFA